MNVYSVSVIFLEATLKRGPRVTKAEIKYVMSAQLKTHLAVHGAGRTMIEKMIDWEKHVRL